jgi:hypothetical protein
MAFTQVVSELAALAHLPVDLPIRSLGTLNMGLRDRISRWTAWVISELLPIPLPTIQGRFLMRSA